MTNPWNQESFSAWHDSLPTERREADEQLLTSIFNKAAAKSPTAKVAIDWAQNHGVKFFVDHTCQEASGYYQQGSGAIGIGKNVAENATGLNENKFLSVLVHEIRHAWQDYHGLIPDMKQQDYLSYYTLLSIMEADASAFQAKFEHETFSDLFLRVTGQKARDYDHTEQFSVWYRTLAEFYGSASSRQYAQHLHLEESAAPPDHRFEFDPDLPPIRLGNFIPAQDMLTHIKKGFLGEEWLNSAGIENLEKKILNQTSALKFYNDNKSEPDAVVQAICRKQGLHY